MHDEEILKLPKKKALELIYKKYHDDIFRYSYALVGNKTDAEDITSNTFLELSLKIDAFDWRSITIKAWLLKTAKFKFYSLIKKFNKVDTKNDFFFNLPDINVSVENDAINDSLMRSVRESLKFLTNDEQEIIALRIWEDLKFKEIAEILNSNSDAVKKKYYRSIDKLRSSVGKEKVDYKKLRLMILGFGDFKKFKPTNISVPHAAQFFTYTKTLIPVTIILAGVSVAAVSNTYFFNNKANNSLSAVIKQNQSNNQTDISDPENIFPTDSDSSQPKKITLKYPAEKTISFEIPGEWRVLKRGFRICTGDKKEENGEYAFVYLYSKKFDASLELNFSAISELKLRPNLSDFAANNIGNINILGKSISTDSISSNVIVYNSGQPIIYQDMRFTVFAYSGNVLTEVGTEKPLQPDFVGESGGVLGSLGYG